MRSGFSPPQVRHSVPMIHPLRTELSAARRWVFMNLWWPVWGVRTKCMWHEGNFGIDLIPKPGYHLFTSSRCSLLTWSSVLFRSHVIFHSLQERLSLQEEGWFETVAFSCLRWYRIQNFRLTPVGIVCRSQNPCISMVRNELRWQTRLHQSRSVIKAYFMDIINR